jgi:hypothetical protein
MMIDFLSLSTLFTGMLSVLPFCRFLASFKKVKHITGKHYFIWQLGLNASPITSVKFLVLSRCSCNRNFLLRLVGTSGNELNNSLRILYNELGVANNRKPRNSYCCLLVISNYMLISLQIACGQLCI